ncbi:polysaccharide pyruvyl transferase family protein [Methanobrevibacter sp.]|uniref:polysaccharide pyruvyl transferase family protein n=1 Tax=Methanobrevibacter sp. TaxID=66852 RepID=UPI00260F7639|nr:polysaccharide pyruvyl transferase family protein [uncultured Methanobrevibacter sp.]
MLKYDYTRNLGDQIQSIAANKFIPHIDHFIDRAELSNFCSDEKVKTILNAWYFHYESTWPPSNSIDPLITSIHINLNDEKVINSFTSDESIEYMKKNGPIGARDISTLNFLNENKIPSYFSGCLTLTLDKNPKVKNQDYIVTSDVPKEIITFLKSKTNKKIYNVTQMAPLNIEKPQESNISLYNSKEKFILANSLLDLYQGASCVITNRLHVALPCLAFNTPVLLINNYEYDVDRFSGLKNLFLNTSLEGYISNHDIFDVNDPTENKKDYLKLRKDLINKCKSFTGYTSNERTSFDGDYNYYTYLISKISNNINKNITGHLKHTIIEDDVKLKNKIIYKKSKVIKKQNEEIKMIKSSKSWKITKPIRFLKDIIK